MTERVSIVEGKRPVIFVAPHGPDDTNTGIVARSAAESLGGYAVINNGWRRGPSYDYDTERANCNDITHLVDVPGDEFLKPLIRFTNRILKCHPLGYIFYIHGMANNLADLVVGFGAGTPSSHTCKLWMKDLFIHQCEQASWDVYEGRPGGRYSAWSSKNLCQFFRRKQHNPRVHAMQLEFAHELRQTPARAELCGECLAGFVEDVLNNSNWKKPADFAVKKL